jgi:hypothetical protein
MSSPPRAVLSIACDCLGSGGNDRVTDFVDVSRLFPTSVNAASQLTTVLPVSSIYIDYNVSLGYIPLEQPMVQGDYNAFVYAFSSFIVLPSSKCFR